MNILELVIAMTIYNVIWETMTFYVRSYHNKKILKEINDEINQLNKGVKWH